MYIWGMLLIRRLYYFDTVQVDWIQDRRPRCKLVTSAPPDLISFDRWFNNSADADPSNSM